MSLDFNRLCYTNEGKGSYITLKDLKRFLESIDPDEVTDDYDSGRRYELELLIKQIEETLKERKETP
jgi:hypothetical protein